MNPNWLGVLAAILALVASFVVHRAAQGLPVGKRVAVALVAIILAIPGASFATYYLHILPEPGWYYQFRSIIGTEFLIVFIGVAGGLVATLLPRVLRIFPLLGVAAFSIAPVIKPFIGPIPVDALRDEWAGDVCLQSTGSTCGAASTATILKQLGVDVTESDLVAEAHSYVGGTEAWYLARSARARGCEVDFSCTPGFTAEQELPAVVGVRLGVIGHFIPILGREGDRLIVGDPLRGRELLSREALEARYDFTGFHMRIRREGSRDLKPVARAPEL